MVLSKRMLSLNFDSLAKVPSKTRISFGLLGKDAIGLGIGLGIHFSKIDGTIFDGRRIVGASRVGSIAALGIASPSPLKFDSLNKLPPKSRISFPLLGRDIIALEPDFPKLMDRFS